MGLRLNRVLQHAVSYALLGSTAACGGQTLEATETNVARPVEGPEGAPGDGSGAPGDGSEERQALAQAAHTAMAELRQELTRDPGHRVREVAGMPAPEQALALLDALEAELWSTSSLAAA